MHGTILFVFFSSSFFLDDFLLSTLFVDNFRKPILSLMLFSINHCLPKRILLLLKGHFNVHFQSIHTHYPAFNVLSNFMLTNITTSEKGVFIDYPALNASISDLIFNMCTVCRLLLCTVSK